MSAKAREVWRRPGTWLWGDLRAGHEGQHGAGARDMDRFAQGSVRGAMLRADSQVPDRP